MTSNPKAPRRWTSIVFQGGIVVVAFGLGWYFAPGNAGNTLLARFKSIPVSEKHGNSASSPKSPNIELVRANLVKFIKGSMSPDDLRKYMDYVSGLDVGTIKAVLADMDANPIKPKYTNYQAEMMLLSRLVELDPKATFNDAQSIVDPKMKSDRIEMILTLWAGSSPSDVVAALSQLPDGEKNAMWLGDILPVIADQDPQTALTLLKSLPAGGQYKDYISKIFESWARNDPAAAATGTLELPASTNRTLSMKAVAAAWAAQDPTAALAWANALPASAGKQDVLNAAVEAMVKQDPEAAAEYASKLPIIPKNSQFIQNVYNGWAQQDPTALVTWADGNLKGVAHDTAIQAAINNKLLSDPVAAAGYVAKLSDLSSVKQSISDLADFYSAKDSHAAFTWALSLPTTSEDVRQLALVSTFSDLATNPTQAAAQLQNLTSDPAFGSLAAQLVGAWSAKDPQAAMAWAEALPQGSARDTSIAAVASQMAGKDPQAAVTFAQQLPDGGRDLALGKIIPSWARQAPAQASAALQSMTPGVNLDSATTAVATTWLQQDPAAASQWIDTLPQGSARDGAVTQLIATVSKNDPATGFNWAATIGDETTRNAQVVKTATQWANKDVAKAAAAAQNAMTLPGLTVDQTTALQKIVDRAAMP